MADQYISSVTLLLHCDGANTSTVFTDKSLTANVVTAYGNAAISTTQSKFGGSSAYFDGSGDYLTTASVNCCNFGTTRVKIRAGRGICLLPQTDRAKWLHPRPFLRRLRADGSMHCWRPFPPGFSPRRPDPPRKKLPAS